MCVWLTHMNWTRLKEASLTFSNHPQSVQKIISWSPLSLSRSIIREDSLGYTVFSSHGLFRYEALDAEKSWNVNFLVLSCGSCWDDGSVSCALTLSCGARDTKWDKAVCAFWLVLWCNRHKEEGWRTRPSHFVGTSKCEDASSFISSLVVLWGARGCLHLSDWVMLISKLMWERHHAHII